MRTQFRPGFDVFEAATNEYTSPIVWKVLNRETKRVPSPSRICIDMVGSDSLICIVGLEDACDVLALPVGLLGISETGPGAAVGLPSR